MRTRPTTGFAAALALVALLLPAIARADSASPILRWSFDTEG